VQVRQTITATVTTVSTVAIAPCTIRASPLRVRTTATAAICPTRRTLAAVDRVSTALTVSCITRAQTHHVYMAACATPLTDSLSATVSLDITGQLRAL